MKTYKYTDATNRIVHIIDEDGVSRGSCLAAAVPDGATILPADPLPVSTQIAEINAECQRRILAVYPDWFQRNVANNMETDTALIAQMKIDIPAMRVESNRISDLITAGQPYTPNWPI